MRKLLFASLCVFWASTVDATMIDFTSAPSASQPGTIAFGADGSLSGSIPLTSITGGDTTLAIADGVISFAFAGATPNGPDNFYYSGGGSFAITGTLPGGSAPETFLSGTFAAFPQITRFGPVLPDAWFFLVPAAFTATLSQDLATLFGERTNQRGTMVILFHQPIAGGATTLSGSQFHIGTTSPSVPEPASLLLVAVGIPAGLCVSRRVRRRDGMRFTA